MAELERSDTRATQALPTPVGSTGARGSGEAPVSGVIARIHGDALGLDSLERARALLEYARTVADAKDIRDTAVALEVYLRQARAGHEMTLAAAEIRLRAERRAGALLQETIPHKGGRKHLSCSTTVKLSDLGISRDQSSAWQRLAAIPQEEWDKAIATTRKANGELTTAALLKLAPLQRPQSPKKPKLINRIPAPAPTRPCQMAQLKCQKVLALSLADLAIDDVVETIADDGRSKFGQRGSVVATYPDRGTVLLYPTGGGTPWEAHPAELVLVEKAETREVQGSSQKETRAVQATPAPAHPLIQRVGVVPIATLADSLTRNRASSTEELQRLLAICEQATVDLARQVEEGNLKRRELLQQCQDLQGDKAALIAEVKRLRHVIEFGPRLPSTSEGRRRLAYREGVL